MRKKTRRWYTPCAIEKVYPRSHGEEKVGPSPAKLTEAEQDLLTHLEQGYQLETDSLGGNPVLRRPKDDEVIRPLSANRNTIKALEERALIHPGNGRDPLTMTWYAKKKR